jgi:NAD(P)-dependent dehydrogenase (short-subunit alcohol dehydrogenase family)
LAACRGFAQLGARVRAVARDDRRAEGAARQIRQAAPKADVRRLGCDMASIQALRSLAVRLNARPVNLTAPDPVTNAELSHALGRVLHRPAVLPVPAPALRVLYGEMAQIVTTGQRVVPRRLRKPDSSSATPTSSRLCVTFSQRRADPGLTKGGRRYCFASASARRRGR